MRDPKVYQMVLAAEDSRPICKKDDPDSVLKFTAWVASWDGPPPITPVVKWIAKVHNRWSRLLRDAKELGVRRPESHRRVDRSARHAMFLAPSWPQALRLRLWWTLRTRAIQ